MKFYVATKFENKHAAKAYMAAITYFGHTITHDWTDEDGGSDPQKCAINDIAGVVEADAVVLVWYPKMKGAFIEMGAALGLGKPVYIVGFRDDSHIFYEHPNVYHYMDHRRFFDDLKENCLLHNNNNPGSGVPG